MGFYWQLIVRQNRDWRVYCYITEEGAQRALEVMRERQAPAQGSAQGARCFIRKQEVY